MMAPRAATFEYAIDPVFDPGSECYHVEFDADSPTKITTIVVLSLGRISGDDPARMLPLNRAVDPDVLEAHVEGRDRGAELSFDFHGHHVSVRDDGRITVSPLDERDE